MTDEGIYYGDYLGLDDVLASQRLESSAHGETVHDEMLFIIVHQSYELWFKQIIWELDSILDIFGEDTVEEEAMGVAVHRLRRIIKIQGLLIEMIGVLETMTPLDFLDFRDYLFPASGFQSAQFRIVENKLGLRRSDRLLLAGDEYTARFDTDDKETVEHSEEGQNLFALVERWLERTPFLDHEDFHFWEAYREAVHNRIQADREVVQSNEKLTDDERAAQLKEFGVVLNQYEALFDPDKHQLEQDAGRMRLSQRAFQAAVFITLYRDQPALQTASLLLQSLMDIDEGFTTWRYRHAQMALRMIGRRVGTGGSAGAKYLEKSAERSRVFSDLLNMSTFLVPRADRPKLPAGIVEAMQFKFDG
ncbi:MAG: tryptophan 2,3-dioxygenase family protein [Acidimicrobiia bacterium]